jgi:hypothetical protein
LLLNNDNSTVCIVKLLFSSLSCLSQRFSEETWQNEYIEKTKTYHIVRTVPKYNRKTKTYHIVGTVLKYNRKTKTYHIVRTVLKYNRKTKTYHIVGTVLKYNRTIVEKASINTPYTHIHDPLHTYTYPLTHIKWPLTHIYMTAWYMQFNIKKWRVCTSSMSQTQNWRHFVFDNLVYHTFVFTFWILKHCFVSFFYFTMSAHSGKHYLNSTYYVMKLSVLCEQLINKVRELLSDHSRHVTLSDNLTVLMIIYQ